ncbi:enoyl-CoA hydratase-related protein (plasmid) [Streptomyces sp. BI20]|uniref:enoyl-CoA hydratase-related protein n=1 Tax=Streptomyces sp. BI20 TaxID=3403460 RepID=UPI003C7221E5
MTPTPDTAVRITLTAPVAEVRLHQPAHHNHITPALRAQLPAALTAAAGHDAVRAIVLSGLPEVFCAGATPEDLTAPGPARTLDGWAFVRAAAECPLPVVAAVRGQAIGGGLLLALYADAVVLSESGTYAANFLAHGFTPCLGSTHLLPAVLGTALGTEMLYTARPYTGRELAARGAGTSFAPHDRVLDRAHATARRVARAPRTTLELLKAQLAAPRRAAAERALAAEIDDHRATLAHHAHHPTPRPHRPSPPAPTGSTT